MSDGFVADGFVESASYVPWITMLIIEDGSIVSEADGDDDDANAYVDADDVTAFALLNGLTWSPSTEALGEQAIIRSMLYVESFETQFAGSRVSELQVLSWPRAYVPNAMKTDYLASDAIPKGIKYAVCEGAVIELASPNALLSASKSMTGGMTRQRKKIGPLETDVEYSDIGLSSNATIFERFNALLSPFLVPATNKVIRG